MKIIETHLPGVIIIEPKLFGDKRGFFLETYREDILNDAGINAHFVQDNHSRSTRGVLRGMHYQMQHTQGKLVRVATGAVYDVAVDVRHGSPTFGQWYGTELNEENMRMMYVPAGYAHGFVVLSATTDFMYKCTDYYHPQSEQGIAWDDPNIGIEWPITDVTLSEKDKNNVSLKNQLVQNLPDFQNFKTISEK
jgi:dTDP-4-dehydrorhamnose 3,5-epimerase